MWRMHTHMYTLGLPATQAYQTTLKMSVRPKKVGKDRKKDHVRVLGKKSGLREKKLRSERKKLRV